MHLKDPNLRHPNIVNYLVRTCIIRKQSLQLQKDIQVGICNRALGASFYLLDERDLPSPQTLQCCTKESALSPRSMSPSRSKQHGKVFPALCTTLVRTDRMYVLVALPISTATIASTYRKLFHQHMHAQQHILMFFCIAAILKRQPHIVVC